METNDKQFQVLYVELSNGKIGAFIGPPIFEQDKPDVTIKSFKVSPPQPYEAIEDEN